MSQPTLHRPNHVNQDQENDGADQHAEVRVPATVTAAPAVAAIEVEQNTPAPAPQQSEDDSPPVLQGYKLQIAIALVVVKFVVGLVLMIISIIAYVALSLATQDMASTANSWSLAPLQDVTSVASGSSCPSGYDAVPMINFPGTLSSCDCPTNGYTGSGAFKTPGLYKKVCNSSQYWCFDYPSQPAQNLYWKGATICTKKFADSKMIALNRPRASSAKACPTGYTPCSTGATAAEIFCTSSTCPVTSYVISSASSVSGHSCSSLVPASGTTPYLCKSNSTSPWPLVFSNIQDAGAPCWPGADSLDPRSDNDVRLGYISRCSESDPRWAIVDSQTPQAIYAAAANPIQNLPSGSIYKYSHFLSSAAGNRYSASDFPAVVVAAQSESQWAQTCPVPRATIASEVDAVSSITKAQLAILILSVIGVIAINMIIGYFELQHLLSGGGEDEDERDTHVKKNFISIVLSIAKIIPISIAYNAASLVGGDIHSVAIASPACTDPVTVASFVLLDTTASGIVAKNRTLVVFAVLEIVATLFDCYKVTKRSNKVSSF